MGTVQNMSTLGSKWNGSSPAPSKGNAAAGRGQTDSVDGDIFKVQGICQPDEAIRRLGGLPDLYADIVGRLLDDASGVYARLTAAVAAEDPTRSRAAAHSLKGLALMCGAVGLGDAARALEDATRPGVLPPWKPLMTRIDGEMTQARLLLSPYR